VPFFDTPLAGVQQVPSAPSAILIVLHGLAEHCGRYERQIAHLAATGLACFAYDQRGHGRSPGARADIARFSLFADDFAGVRAGIGRRYPQLPVFVWAHSLGSIVALLSALDPRNQLAGVITTGCAIRAVPPFPAPVYALASTLTALLPTLRIDPGLDVEGLSHDPGVQQAYLQDPLVQKKVSLHLAFELGRTCRHVLANAPSIQVPWLAVHGAGDPIAPPEGSKELIERLGSRDKQLRIEPGLRHEVHNELEPAATQFLQLMAGWIRERTRPL
jgi:alpha-beta hydrolase superfamily lysophospholipase